MPKLGEPTIRPHEGNGKAGRRPWFAERLAEQLRGTDAIVIGSAESPVPGDIEDASMADVAKRVAGIRYLVKGWIPFAMTTMLVAEPGKGKSAFALYGLVRPIVCATDWFNGMTGPAKTGFALWCDTEGTAAITVQRIKDWNLPAHRIKVPFADDPLRSVNLTNLEHLEQIEAVTNKHRCKLVVIDSLRGAHDGDENNSRVAHVLKELASIAERTKAAIIIVHHTRKLYVDEELTANSSRGSNAILAMVRSQLGIDKPDKTSDWMRLQMLKENLGLKPRPIGFRIGAKGLEFGAAPERPRKETRRDKAEEWLLQNMTPGKWYKAAELRDEAEQGGFSETALRRARNELGIVKPDHVRKTADGWEWRLPKASSKRAPKMATP